MIQPCPCDASKQFHHCCQPLLSKTRSAKTPLQLMRSRYSAYALGGFGDYLLLTWLADNAVGLTAAELSIRALDWQGLEILTHHQQGDHGAVEFMAWYLDHNGKLTCHHEKSLFQRINGSWYYAGVVTD